jgi:hypothetical protein
MSNAYYPMKLIDLCMKYDNNIYAMRCALIPKLTFVSRRKKYYV